MTATQNTATPAPVVPDRMSDSGTPVVPHRPDGIRDTIESIVVAFILAFVFRAFMVEAFVIPTGSMAPGLMGQHAQHRCALCRYSFVYGIREDMQTADGRPIAGTLRNQFDVQCPNCGYSRGGNTALNKPDRRVVASAGDRILVLKWPYDIGGDLLGPKRWDVVVFKDPTDGDTNFIKRLIGLPGEVVQIIDGDIFTASAKDVPEDIRAALSVPPPRGMPDARRLTPPQFEKLASLLQIRRKTPVAQESLWMLHYDHDFQPDLSIPGPPDFNPPVWRPEAGDSGWDASTPRVKFSPKSNVEQWIRLEGKPIEDNYGYNDVSIHKVQHRGKLVGDVLISMVAVPLGGQGHLSLSLRKGADEFVARVQVDGSVTLSRIGEREVTVELDRKKIEPLEPGRSLKVEFENLDFRVALRINGEEIVATSDAQYAPDPVNMVLNYGRDDVRNAATVRLGAQQLPLEIRHLTICRDVYYRSDCTLEELNQFNRPNPYANLAGWGTTLNPILLREDPPDFYCLGDNSPQSKDSRLWWEACQTLRDRNNYQIGTVPGDQLIGRAFFVYWPSGYRLSKETPAVIPNIGRMRMIR